LDILILKILHIVPLTINVNQRTKEFDRITFVTLMSLICILFACCSELTAVTATCVSVCDYAL